MQRRMLSRAQSLLGPAASLLMMGALSASAQPTQLRTELMDAPLSVSVPRPQLSWRMIDDRRGARQTSYRVLAASQPTLLREGQADLWDSGRVFLDQSVYVDYAGKPLKPRQTAYWTVQTWDKDGRGSGYAKFTRFELAPDGSKPWDAKWIGMPIGETSEEAYEDVRWIWYPEGNPRLEAPKGVRYFRVEFNVPDGKKVQAATLEGIADNSFEAFLNGQKAGTGAGWPAFELSDVTSLVTPGTNVLAVAGTNGDGPGGVALLLKVRFTDGTMARIPTGSNWKVQNAAETGWQKPDHVDSNWKPALAFAKIGEAPWGTPSSASVGGPAPMVRKDFLVDKPIAKARVYVTALGSYRLHINGKRVGNDLLTPDWTDYTKRIPYQVYDVTSMLDRGENVVGALIGDGWFASGLGFALKRYNFGSGPPRLLMELRINYTDGSEKLVTTDETWVGAQSPILRSELYAGETYDAGLEQPGWDNRGFGASGWSPVRTYPETTARLVPQTSPLIRVTESVRPIAITRPAAKTYVFDMGQNMVGWVRLKVKASAGTKIRLRFAEILKSDGNIYTENLRKADATDTYICRSDAEENFEPHFTYHGFRYVEITGYPGKPTLETITGRVFHTDLSRGASFASSSPLVNQIWKNITWGLRSNLHSVPTDCPQRDERLGWMGDANIIWRTLSYFMDTATFTRKWVADMEDAQSKNGAFSDVVPRVVHTPDAAPAWGCAGVIVPYESYRANGDLKLLESHWSSMEGWMTYILEANPNLLWLNRRNSDFGDWVPAESETPKEVLATAFWANDARRMAEMARALGKSREARKYDELYQGIRAAFTERFLKPDGTVGNGSQTCQALALAFRLVPDAARASVADVLVKDIEKRNGHLSCGFLGTPFLLPALSESGHVDVAYRLLLNDTYPSWGYAIRKGATTIWERWNGDTGDPAMNSYNHYAFGCVADWMFGFAAGIRPDPSTPGYKKSVIVPHLDTRLTFARATVDTYYGPVSSEWRLEPKGKITMNVVVPPNTSVTIYVPTRNAASVLEGGKSAKQMFLKTEGVYSLFKVDAGTYRFVADAP